jgi:hypothetical protein
MACCPCPVCLLLILVVIAVIAFYLWFSKLELKFTSKNTGEQIASLFKQHGVKHIFTLPGGHVSPINVESEKVSCVFCALLFLLRLTNHTQLGRNSHYRCQT